MYSCRAELDEEMEKLEGAIQRAKSEYVDEEVLKEGSKAQKLLPILQSLCDEPKFHTVQELQEEIENLNVTVDNMDGIHDRIPLVRRINKLTSLVALNKDKDKEMDAGAPAITATDNTAGVRAIHILDSIPMDDECRSSCGDCHQLRRNERGCSCESCRHQVCAVTPDCCTQGWGLLCAVRAILFCDLYEWCCIYRLVHQRPSLGRSRTQASSSGSHDCGPLFSHKYNSYRNHPRCFFSSCVNSGTVTPWFILKFYGSPLYTKLKAILWFHYVRSDLEMTS